MVWALAFFASHRFWTKQHVGVQAGAHVEGQPTAQVAGGAGGGGGGAGIACPAIGIGTYMVCSWPGSAGPPQHEASHAGAQVCAHPPWHTEGSDPPTRRFWSKSAVGK